MTERSSWFDYRCFVFASFWETLGLFLQFQDVLTCKTTPLLYLINTTKSIHTHTSRVCKEAWKQADVISVRQKKVTKGQERDVTVNQNRCTARCLGWFWVKHQTPPDHKQTGNYTCTIKTIFGNALTNWLLSYARWSKACECIKSTL